MKGTLYIIEDHPMVRNGLKSWLENNTEWKITGEAATQAECIDLLNKTETFNHPEIMIVDVMLVNDELSFCLVRDLTITHPHIKCVMYSMNDSNGFVMEARESGAKGFISKASSEQELVKCLKIVSEGGTYVEDRMKNSVSKTEEILKFLTKQEKRVFFEILEGKTNKQISNNLCLTIHSVENYVSRLYEKLGVNSHEDILYKYK